MACPPAWAARTIYGMRFAQPDGALLGAAAHMPTTPAVGMTPAQIEDEITAGRLRLQWSVVAVDDGMIAGRALWWGRSDQTPIALEVWDARRDHPEKAAILAGLLAYGHDLLTAEAVDVPLPHIIQLPTAWRDDSVLRREVETKTTSAAAVGLTHVNERHQFQWDQGAPIPPEVHRLRFEGADDGTFIEMFARAAHGSLDVMTRRELSATDAETLAKDEVEFYRSCPGDRDWWRIARDLAGEVVGVAIPSATPTSRNVGYLAVLPEHRGHGYGDDLLAYITRFHVREGAHRITGTTDAVNAPMAAAFERAGYECTETRISLER